jgi:hypothetical protein
MKVLEKKIPFADFTMEVTCTGENWEQGDKIPCGSKLEINSDDLLRREWSKYPDDNGIDYGFICPVCGCFTQINSIILPKDLRKMAKDYLEVTGKKVVE